MKKWLQASRLRTLPLSVSGIILGCFLAEFDNHAIIYDELVSTDYSIFFLALLTTIFFQVLSNFANDYGDGIKGTDDDRIGEKRLIASGIITTKQMKIAIVIMIFLSISSAIAVIYLSFGKENFLFSLLFFVLGLISIIAAINYTVGENAYGYSGFGDLFVFLFFGWLSVLGSYFLYQKNIPWDLFLPATSIGLLSVAVLNLNNMRDRIPDKKAGKNTLVVKLGSQKSKWYHYSLICLALLCAVVYVQHNYHSPQQYLFLIAFIPLVLNIIVVYQNVLNRELDRELKKVAISTFLFALLLGIFGL